MFGSPTLHIKPAQTGQSLRGSSLILWSTLAAGLAAAIVAGLLTLAGPSQSDALRTALIAGSASTLAALVGAMLVLTLSLGRQAPPAMGILAGSILRMVAAVALGVAARYALDPATAPFWASVVAGWLVAKAVEVRLLWPLVCHGLAPRQTAPRDTPR